VTGLFALLAVLGSNGLEILDNTGIFTRPDSETIVMVGPDRGFWIDRDGSRLLAFDFDDRTTRAVAARGKGPGDIERPTWIGVIGGRVMVLDRNGFQAFDPDGSFLERIRIPADLVVRPTLQGWFGARGARYAQNTEPLEAVSIAPDFGKTWMLGTWLSEADRGESREPTGFPMPWNPVESFTRFTIDKQGRYGYVLPKAVDAIHIFDLEQKTEIGIIRFPDRKIPFDDDWGRAQLKQLEDSYAHRDQRFRLEPDFPEVFPAIRRFAITAENRLVVVLWDPGRPADGHQYGPGNTRIFDLEGNPLEPNERDYLWHRIVAITDRSTVFWLFHEETDAYAVARCANEDLERWLLQFPVDDH